MRSVEQGRGGVNILNNVTGVPVFAPVYVCVCACVMCVCLVWVFFALLVGFSPSPFFCAALFIPLPPLLLSLYVFHALDVFFIRKNLRVYAERQRLT